MNESSEQSNFGFGNVNRGRGGGRGGGNSSFGQQRTPVNDTSAESTFASHSGSGNFGYRNAGAFGGEPTEQSRGGFGGGIRGRGGQRGGTITFCTSGTNGLGSAEQTQINFGSGRGNGNSSFGQPRTFRNDSSTGGTFSNESGNFGHRSRSEFGDEITKKSRGDFGGGRGRGQRFATSYEGQGFVSNETSNNRGFAKSQGASSGCYRCGQVGHFSRDCTEPSKEREPQLNVDGEPINRKYVPEIRQVDELYLEDKAHAREYLDIVDDDEDVTVTPNDPNVMKLDNWRDAQFEELLYTNIERAKYMRPRKIQTYTIPFICRDRDVLGHAETGSGKTAAYMLPIVDYCLKKKKSLYGGYGSSEIREEVYPSPYALIILPTRELTLQICEQGRKFASGSTIQVHAIYGGCNYNELYRKMLKGCDILCATPGILRMMVQRSEFSLKEIQYLVLDEADRLLFQGKDPGWSFTKVIEEIFATPTFPLKKDRVNLMFSATFTTEVQNLARNIVLRENAVMVSNGKWQSSNHRISQHVMLVHSQEKFDTLKKIMQKELKQAEKNNPNNPRIRPIIIFVDAKRRAKQLALYLTTNNIPTTLITGDMSQDAREKALNEFRSNRTPVLVATDVLSRGIDIKELDYVINCDLTDEVATYVHRIGRTGRIREGLATTFVDPSSDRDCHFAKHLIQILIDSHAEVPPWLTQIAQNQFNPSSILSNLSTSERTSSTPSQVLPLPDIPLASEQEITSVIEQTHENIREIPTPSLANSNPPKTEQSKQPTLQELLESNLLALFTKSKPKPQTFRQQQSDLLTAFTSTQKKADHIGSNGSAPISETQYFGLSNDEETLVVEKEIFVANEINETLKDEQITFITDLPDEKLIIVSMNTDNDQLMATSQIAPVMIPIQAQQIVPTVVQPTAVPVVTNTQVQPTTNPQTKPVFYDEENEWDNF